MTAKINMKPIDVLLVDDDAADRRLVKLALTGSCRFVQFNVETAGSFSEASEYLSCHSDSCDVILLDLGLPDSSGIDTVRRVHDTSSNIPIVVLTGLDDEEAGLEAIRVGAEDYLAKGETLAYVLVRTIRYAIERKRANEQQAELLREVKSANRELKDFAYIVSHDLKAPLRGIKTLADWMVADYADKLGEEGREQMNLLVSRVGRMRNLIDGILEYSRAGHANEKQVQVNLNELVADVIDMVSPPDNIEVEVEDKLPVLECEETRIAQVFGNLLSNAIRYMDKANGKVRIGCVEEDGFWKFSVSDNGPGIEEKYFGKIFQIFQTLSPRDEVESTGVGLTVVKKIVELYGGRIWVESKVGEGSTFFFTLAKQESEVKDDEEFEADIACRR